MHMTMHLQDELAVRLEELQEQINIDSTAEPEEAQLAAAVTPEDRKGGGNPIKHIITGWWLPGIVYEGTTCIEPRGCADVERPAS